MSEEKPKAKMGRPTIYNEEIAARICKLVAAHSFGLKKLCRTYPDLPDQDTINEWRRKYDDFSDQYTLAKREQADLMAEEIIDIADDGENDWMETQDDQGGEAWKINGEHIQRSRLRIDSRKWLAAKLSPKIYGVSLMESKEKQLSEIEKMLQTAD